MIKIFKKILPRTIYAYAYVLSKDSVDNNAHLNYELRVFNLSSKSGIEKIDKRLSNTNECYAVVHKEILVHTTWIFKKKLLTKQLGFKGVYTAGDSFTIERYRGKGIYTTVLKIIAAQKKRNIIIFVTPGNLSSIHGIEKAGFKRLFAFELKRFLGFKISCKKYHDQN